MTWAMDILILELIREKKAELLNIVKAYGFNHLKTIQCSQELDHLLNLHEKIKYSST
ncbi:Spo0E family sporulation regulatory protein-aspartic acid phosphatase [Peribacillus frigoritolerans]|uniref:Spo0E family sporulation regulatory protein-aspartic acid phosphatase n=1 Tax=Peribacillus frigoritolerans TaxID=450367 RepID=UPI003F52A6C3